MKWIHDYQLILFDFDGLLVNTEEIHYMAYKRMCAYHGVDLDLSFENYCKIAHYHSEGLSEKLYSEYPKLKEQQPCWEILYAEKKQAMIELIDEQAVQLMPGVEHLLLTLEKSLVPRCVVTHSSSALICAIKKHHPIFNTIPYWITREMYKKPKPHSECYIKAVEMHAKPLDKIIGFEDSPRGLKSLLGTKAKPVLICKANEYPEIKEFISLGVKHYTSFTTIPSEGL